MKTAVVIRGLFFFLLLPLLSTTNSAAQGDNHNKQKVLEIAPVQQHLRVPSLLATPNQFPNINLRKCLERLSSKPFVLLVDDISIDRKAYSIVEKQFTLAENQGYFCVDKATFHGRNDTVSQANFVATQWANNKPDIIVTSVEMSHYLAKVFKNSLFLGFGWTKYKDLPFYWHFPGIGDALADYAGDFPRSPEEAMEDLFGDGPLGGFYEEGPPKGSPGRSGWIGPLLWFLNEVRKGIPSPPDAGPDRIPAGGMPETEPVHQDDHLDAGVPPQEEEKDKDKQESQTDDVYVDFLTVINEFVRNAKRNELWEQIKSGSIPPEHRDDYQAFLNWIRDLQSQAERSEIYDAIVNGRPIDSEMDDTGIAVQFLAFMISRNADIRKNENWKILWRKGAPIDPKPEFVE